jgi:uncharacterized membrane protein
MIGSIEILVRTGDADWMAILLHYLSLALLVILGIMTIRRILLRNVKRKQTIRAVQIVSVLFVSFLLCTEYDNLTVIIAMTGNGSTNFSVAGGELLLFNKYLPYSLLIGVVAASLFFWSVLQHNRFMRSFSLSLALLVLIKVFALDLEKLTPGGRSVLFILLGLVIILSAVFLPRLMKTGTKSSDR